MLSYTSSKFRKSYTPPAARIRVKGSIAYIFENSKKLFRDDDTRIMGSFLVTMVFYFMVFAM